MSMMSAPCATTVCTRSMAVRSSHVLPGWKNESGVRFTIAITSSWLGGKTRPPRPSGPGRTAVLTTPPRPRSAGVARVAGDGARGEAERRAEGGVGIGEQGGGVAVEDLDALGGQVLFRLIQVGDL